MAVLHITAFYDGIAPKLLGYFQIGFTEHIQVKFKLQLSLDFHKIDFRSNL